MLDSIYKTAMRGKPAGEAVRRIEGEERMMTSELKITEKDDQISRYTLTAMLRPGPVEQILKEADRKVP